jgi:tRNA (cytidine/uridine-2'-O-)-methyltransferase
MDYWEHVELSRHITWSDFREATGPRPIRAFTTRATSTIWDVRFGPDDVLLFGPESRGLPSQLLDSPETTSVRIPMADEIRSLNLATAVGVGLYEALRGSGWRGG